MVSYDYTKEIGMDSGTKKVSKPIAISILAIVLIAGWFGIRTIAQSASAEHTKPAAAAH